MLKYLPMFTGIIEEIGIVSSFTQKGKGARVSVALKRAFSDLKTGDSIAVNGVCLTVTEVARNGFSADISDESLKTTNLSHTKIGQKVNLERALSLSARLGGHIMSGHVDCMVELTGKIAKDDFYELLITVPKEMRKFLIQKGSIGLDGVSLTISHLTNDGFAVSLIPHTAQYTTLGQKQIRDKLNFEADVLSKYVERFFSGESMSQTEQVFMDAGFLPIGIINN